MVTLINGLGIYENIFSKEPINSETQSFSNFSIDFKQIAKRNKKFILGGKIDKGVTYKDLDKKSFPCWRPNAIYGNRANGISTDRVIMGSGLFFFDIDFKSEINLDNNYREEIRKLDSLLNGYKEHLILNFKESIVALYKSISRTGLHLVFEGVTTPDADEFKKAWYIYKAYLEKNFKYLKGYIDESCCNLNRASYIGSDDNPFLNDDKVMIPLVLDEAKELKQVTRIIKNFAKVQCNVKTNIIEEGRRIHSIIDSMDISESNIIYIAENYNTEINLDVKGKKEKRTLEAAYQFYCGKTLVDAHSAAADTNATYEVLKAQLARYDDLNNTISSLAEFSMNKKFADFAGYIGYDKQDREIFNFGKHKGSLVLEVLDKEPGYFGWLLNADFPLYTKKVLTKIKLSRLNTKL